LPSLEVRTAQVFTVSLSWVRPKTNGVTPGHVSHPVTISFRVFTSYRAIPIARTRRLSSAIIPYAVLSKNSRMHWSAKILSGLYNSAISRVSLTKIPCGLPQMPFRGGAKSVSRSRHCLSLANEIRRCTRVQVSTVRTPISKPRGEAARSLVDSGFSGSPSFVAVMQPTDLR